MPIYEPVTDDVINLAESLIDQYHPMLRRAKIALLFVEKASRSGGHYILGTAQRVGAKWNALLDDDYHFLIILAKDFWEDKLDNSQRRALLDHELCHCFLDVDWKPKLRNHDIEEFNCIIERHGLYLDDLRRTAQVIQEQQLPLNFDELENGRVGTVTSVTISSGDKEVTLTPETAKKVEAAAKKLRDLGAKVEARETAE